MQIICSQCKKVYSVNSSKIPPDVTSTRCKACGNAISLRPDAQQPTPQGAPPAQSNIMQITCQYCSQQFKINSKVIPQGVTSTRCKACGSCRAADSKGDQIQHAKFRNPSCCLPVLRQKIQHPGRQDSTGCKNHPMQGLWPPHVAYRNSD